MAKPAIVLVHGFWGGAAHWAKVIVQLSKMGYESIHAVENPLTSLADDAARTKKMLAQQRGPVVLVGHSYGGAVITEAGNQPNVAALVYIAAFAPEAGESIGSIGQAAPPPPGILNAAPDLPHDEQLVMAATQKAPIVTTAGDKVTAPAWKAKPSWYQISSEDRMIHPDNEKRMAERMGAKRIITLHASHASLASKPHEVSGLIDEAAKATA